MEVINNRKKEISFFLDRIVLTRLFIDFLLLVFQGMVVNYRINIWCLKDN